MQLVFVSEEQGTELERCAVYRVRTGNNVGTVQCTVHVSVTDPLLHPENIWY